VSVLDPLLGAALDRPTYSLASPIVSRNEHSEAVKISTSMPVPSNNTCALRCPSATAVQEPCKPLGEVGTPGDTPYKGPRHSTSKAKNLHLNVLADSAGGASLGEYFEHKAFAQEHPESVHQFIDLVNNDEYVCPSCHQWNQQFFTCYSYQSCCYLLPSISGKWTSGYVIFGFG
jgi:hypothetical protein